MKSLSGPLKDGPDGVETLSGVPVRRAGSNVGFSVDGALEGHSGDLVRTERLAWLMACFGGVGFSSKSPNLSAEEAVSLLREVFSIGRRFSPSSASSSTALLLVAGAALALGSPMS